jgi:hypothetical protein
VVEMLKFGSIERRTKDFIPVAPVSSEVTTMNLDDVSGSSELLDRQSWKLTNMR